MLYWLEINSLIEAINDQIKKEKNHIIGPMIEGYIPLMLVFFFMLSLSLSFPTAMLWQSEVSQSLILLLPSLSFYLEPRDRV